MDRMGESEETKNGGTATHHAQQRSAIGKTPAVANGKTPAVGIGQGGIATAERRIVKPR